MVSGPLLAVVLEAWGENEERLKRPVVGASGAELMNMFHESGILTLTPYDREMISQWWTTRQPHYLALVWDAHPEVYLTNVFNLRPPRNDIETLCSPKAGVRHNLPPLRAGKYISDTYLTELERLKNELLEVKPNLILAMGNTASWALLSNPGITKVRGTVAASKLIPGLKVLPVYHPAAILRDWSLRAVTILDLKKALREKDFPEIRRPKRTIYTEPTLQDLEWFYEQHIKNSRMLAFDIETQGEQITCIGFAPSAAVALVCPFTDYRSGQGSYWPTAEAERSAWLFVRRSLSSPGLKIAQNGLYDVHFLWRNYGIPVTNFEHDTMLLHHALQPESPKGLDFLGSVYTNEASWKLMRPRGKQTIKRDE